MKLLIIPLFIFASCTKEITTPQVIVTSKWYKNNNQWKLDTTTVSYFPKTVDYRSYVGLPVDTLPKNWKELIGVCPTVQIRVWEIKYY
jgi:hypothetical protein